MQEGSRGGSVDNGGDSARGIEAHGSLGIIVKHQIKHWKTYVVVTVVFLVGAALAILFLPYRYTAAVTVASTSSFNTVQTSVVGGGGRISSALSGLLSSSNESTSPFQVFLSLTASRQLAEALEEREDLMERIFEDRWDKENKKWIVGHVALKRWLRIPVIERPTVTDIVQFLGERVEIAPLDQSANLPVSIFSISVETSSPELSSDLLNFIVDTSDRLTREKFGSSYAEQVKEIRKSLEAEADVNIRASLSQMLSTVVTQEVMARTSGPYAVIPIDDGKDQDQVPSWPRPKLLILAALIAAVLVAFLLNVAFVGHLSVRKPR